MGKRRPADVQSPSRGHSEERSWDLNLGQSTSHVGLCPCASSSQARGCSEEPVSAPLSSCEHRCRSWGPSPGCVCVDTSFRAFSRHPCLLDVTHLEVGFRCSVCWRGTTRFLAPRARYPIKAGTCCTCGWAEAAPFLVKEQPQGRPAFLPRSWKYPSDKDHASYAQSWFPRHPGLPRGHSGMQSPRVLAG